MDSLYSTARYLTRDAEQAADLLQDTLLRAYRSWEQFQPGTNCKAWLMTILYNAFRNRYRAEQRAPVTVDLDETPWASAVPISPDDPADLVAACVLDDEIQAALCQLPHEYLTAVALVDLQDLTYQEAATVAGCPVGTIRSRLSRGRWLLHAALQEYAKRRGLLR
jgi:RNA polymerase sigma-70 factor (ECF subfamily)